MRHVDGQVSSVHFLWHTDQHCCGSGLKGTVSVNGVANQQGFHHELSLHKVDFDVMCIQRCTLLQKKWLRAMDSG